MRRALAHLVAAAAIGVVAIGFALPASGQTPPGQSLPEVDGWGLAAALIDPVSEQAVAELDDVMYVIGGYPPGRIPWANVQIFDSAAGRWSHGPELPVPLHHVMAAAANGKVYAIGGEFDGAGTGRPEVYVDTLYELNPAAATWTKRAPMPTGRSAGGATVMDGKIYVAGGRPPRGKDFAVYDPAADAWSVLPEVPTGRNHLAVVALNGKVHVAGGRFGAGFNSQTTDVHEIFDPATGTWSSGAPMPTSRGGVAAVEGNGCMFVIGGEGNYTDPRGLFNQNEVYDPRDNTWRSLPPMPTPAHGLVGSAFISGRVHLPGGSVTIGGGTGSVIHQTYRPSVTCR